MKYIVVFAVLVLAACSSDKSKNGGSDPKPVGYICDEDHLRSAVGIIVDTGVVQSMNDDESKALDCALDNSELALMLSERSVQEILSVGIEAKSAQPAVSQSNENELDIMLQTASLMALKIGQPSLAEVRSSSYTQNVEDVKELIKVIDHELNSSIGYREIIGNDLATLTDVQLKHRLENSYQAKFNRIEGQLTELDKTLLLVSRFEAAYGLGSQLYSVSSLKRRVNVLNKDIAIFINDKSANTEFVQRIESNRLNASKELERLKGIWIKQSYGLSQPDQQGLADQIDQLRASVHDIAYHFRPTDKKCFGNKCSTVNFEILEWSELCLKNL